MNGMTLFGWQWKKFTLWKIPRTCKFDKILLGFERDLLFANYTLDYDFLLLSQNIVPGGKTISKGASRLSLIFDNCSKDCW